ncbi:MAG: YfhO family protein [Candidatus Aminicenantes bacterium]
MKIAKVLVMLLLLGLTLLFLHKLVSLNFISIGHVEDHLRMLYPYRLFDAEQLKSLSLPLWNPYTFSGFPYLASLRCHIFYPVNLLFLLLPAHLGMNSSLILHVFLAGFFMYLLAANLGLSRAGSLVSALTFMFSGYFVDEIWWGHETRLGSITWTPLVFLFFLKAVKQAKPSYAVLSGVILSVQMFSGHLQFPYYGLMALFFFAIFLFLSSLKNREGRKALVPVTSFLIVVVVGIAAAAVQLVPAAELSQFSIREPSADTFALFTRWSMHPSYLITFLFPRSSPIFGASSFPFPVSLGYIGILPLFLAVLSLFLIKNRYVLFFWLLVGLSLFFALGKYIPVYGFLYRFLPGFSAFRNPIFFLYLYVFSVSILCGFGMFFLERRIWMQKERTLKVLAMLMVIGGAVLVLVASLVFIFQMNLTPSADDPGFMEYVKSKIDKFRNTVIYDLGTIGFVVMAGAIPLILLHKRRTRDLILKAVVLMLIFMDLMFYGTKFIRTYDLTPFVSKQKYIDFLKKEDQPFRVLPILDYPEQDPVLKLHKISSINGYGSLEMMEDYVNFIAAFQEKPVTQDACLMRVARYDSRAVDLLNTKYILTTEKIEDERFPLVYTDEIPAAKTWDPDRKDTLKLHVYENKGAFPRAFMVHSVRVEEKRQKILEILKDPRFDPRAFVILEEEPEESGGYMFAEEEKDEISFINYKENQFTLKASLMNHGFLLLSEVYYPGWKAFVDGQPTRIYRANYLFRSVYLNKGDHTVEFFYRPLSFEIGASITVLTLIILMGILLRQIFGKKASQ